MLWIPSATTQCVSQLVPIECISVMFSSKKLQLEMVFMLVGRRALFGRRGGKEFLFFPCCIGGQVLFFSLDGLCKLPVMGVAVWILTVFCQVRSPEVSVAAQIWKLVRSPSAWSLLEGARRPGSASWPAFLPCFRHSGPHIPSLFAAFVSVELGNSECLCRTSWAIFLECYPAYIWGGNFTLCLAWETKNPNVLLNDRNL